MKEKIRTIFIGILIGVIAFPTVVFGGTFVSSLIQGKSVEEAVQILAEQIDFLIGRVEIVETKQIEIESEQSKVKTKQIEQAQTIFELQNIIEQQKEIIETQKDSIEDLDLLQEIHQSQLIKESACRRMDKAEQDFKILCGSYPYPGMEECISHWETILEYEEVAEYREYKLNTLNSLRDLKNQYLSAKDKCEDKK